MNVYGHCPEVSYERFLLRLDLGSDYENEGDIGRVHGDYWVLRRGQTCTL